MQQAIASIYNDFLKKCNKVPDETSQFEVLSLLCKNASSHLTSLPQNDYSALIQAISDAITSNPHESDSSQDLLKKIIQLLVFFYQAKALSRSEHNNASENLKVFQAVVDYVLHLLEAHAKQEKYALFFVRALKKFLKLFKSHAHLFISSLRVYLSIPHIVSALATSQEVNEQDYTTNAAIALGKKYQVIFTLYSETIYSLQLTPETQKILEEEYLHLGFLYLWCQGLSNQDIVEFSKEDEPKYKQIKLSNLVYGAETFLAFFRRNIISSIVSIYRIIATEAGGQNTVHLMKTLMRLFRSNFEYYEKLDTTKYVEDELFRPKSLDYVRLMIHLYEVWPQQHKSDIFHKENEFFWLCLEKGLLVDDSQAKKIALTLLENIVADEKEQVKKAKVPDTKKFIAAYDKVWNCFLNLYKTLENYAVHLVKDLFPTIDILVKELDAKTLQELGSILHNRKDIIFYKAKWLLYILLEKAGTHKNDSITRYFIKSFLKLTINIDEMQEFVYNDLFKMLNMGMFYRDADVQSDSRFYVILSNFFTSYYKKLAPNMLKYHVKKFLLALRTHGKAPSAIVGIILALKDLNSKEIILEKEELSNLILLMRDNGPSFHMRKQHQLFQTVLHLLFFNTNIEEIGVNEIIEIISCFPLDILNMNYKSAKTKEIVWEIMNLQNAQESDNLFRQLLAQDFDFYYKLFAWILVKFDLSKLYAQLSQHIATIFKDANSNQIDFVATLKTLRVLSVVYEIGELKQISQGSHYNASFIELHVDKKDSNVILDELLKPFLHLLSTIYRSTYLQPATCLQLLKHLNSFLEVFSNQADKRTFSFVIRFVDQVFVEATAYIILLLNREINSEEELGHTIDKTIASLVKNLLVVASRSQYYTIKCALLSQSSKFIQDFIVLFRSNVTRETLEPAKLSILLLLFNSILECYNREILYSLHTGQNFFLENELFNASLNLLATVKQIKFTSGFTRTFEDFRQKFLVNYLLLISYDQNIVSSGDYKNLTSDIVQNTQEMVDSHDLLNAQNLFGLLKVVYVPSLISRCKSESPETVEIALGEYKAIFETGIRGLLLTDMYTFTQIQSFTEFIFDERLIIDPIISQRNEIKDIMASFLKDSEKRYLLLRIFVNHFLKVAIKYPYIAHHYTSIFKKLIILKEYRGFEAEVYDKLINQKRDEENEVLPLISTEASYYGAYTRLYTMVYLEQFVTILEEKAKLALEKDISEQDKADLLAMKLFIEDFSKIVLDHNVKGKVNDVVMPYSEPHRKKVHLSQALCIIMRGFNRKIYLQVFKEKLRYSIEHLDYFEKIIWKILEFNNLPSVRQYHEIFILHLLRNFPEKIMPHLGRYLKQKTSRTQFLVSIAWLAGYYITTNIDEPLSAELFVYFFPHVAANTAYVRAIGQFFSMEYLQKKGSEKIDHPVVKEFYENFIHVDKKLNMCKKFDDVLASFKKILDGFDIKTLISTPFDDFGEILHDSVTERFKAECVEMMSIVKMEDTHPPKKEELWQLYLSLHNQEANEILKPAEEEGVANFQKKIEIDEEIFPNDLLIDARKRHENETEKMDIIIVATLLEKVPNFANLTRTCEIFSVAQLVVPNIKMLEDDGFKAISVTAEKWLNMIEVKEQQLMEYLRYKKMCGYTLIGLEQTRASTSLEKFKFPEKCVLLLGNEKEGTPIKYIEMLDAFIEIPQYGKIRSLNVHISAVICIWECVKQKKGLKSE